MCLSMRILSSIFHTNSYITLGLPVICPGTQLLVVKTNSMPSSERIEVVQAIFNFFAAK